MTSTATATTLVALPKNSSIPYECRILIEYRTGLSERQTAMLHGRSSNDYGFFLDEHGDYILDDNGVPLMDEAKVAWADPADRQKH